MSMSMNMNNNQDNIDADNQHYLSQDMLAGSDVVVADISEGQAEIDSIITNTSGK